MLPSFLFVAPQSRCWRGRPLPKRVPGAALSCGCDYHNIAGSADFFYSDDTGGRRSLHLDYF
jgi:hypothetical protein